MPNYDYECGNCKATFEISHSIKDKPKKKCPKCKKNKLLQVINCRSTGLLFVGSGFYINDYK